jgi:hypothetical protein
MWERTAKLGLISYTSYCRILQDTLRQISERSTSGNICSFIAVGALSIGDIMAIFKAMTANYFSKGSRKVHRH